VKISRQLTRDGRGYTEPKTARSTRTIPLAQQVADALSEHIKAYPPLEPDGLLFHSQRGGAYSPGWYSSVVFPEIGKKVGKPALRPHDYGVSLRASWSLKASMLSPLRPIWATVPKRCFAPTHT
jgi:integrase